MLDFIAVIVEVNDAKLGGMRGNKQENISFLALHLKKRDCFPHVCKPSGITECHYISSQRARCKLHTCFTLAAINIQSTCMGKKWLWLFQTLCWVLIHPSLQKPVLNGSQIDRFSSELQPSLIIKKDFLFFQSQLCVWNSSWHTTHFCSYHLPGITMREIWGKSLKIQEA